MKYIKLTQGKLVRVDDEDYKTFSLFKWHFDGRYAARKSPHKVYLHRLIMGNPKLDVDHIDRDKLNCQKNNLRIVNRSENLRNKPAKRVYEVKGRNRWYANLPGGKYLGCYKTEDEAKKALLEAMVKGGYML